MSTTRTAEPELANSTPATARTRATKRITLWHQDMRARVDRRSLARIGLRDFPSNRGQLRDLARFLRGRDARLAAAAYSAYSLWLLGLISTNALTRGHTTVTQAVARAHFAHSDAAVAAANSAGQRVWLLVATLIGIFVVVAAAWILLIATWIAYTTRFGDRDRNVGLATRRLLRTLSTAQGRVVSLRRRMFTAARAWSFAARRAGVDARTINELLEAITSPGSRTDTGATQLRDHIRGFAERYETGELLDGTTVIAQRSRAWPKVAAAVGSITVTVATSGASAALVLWVEQHLTSTG